MWAREAALLRLALLQLAVHVRPAVRARPVRPVPRRPRAFPRRLRRRCCRVPGWTPPRSSAAAFGLDVTGRGVLDGEPRRAARPHRPSTRRLADCAVTRRDTATTPSRDELAELLAGEPRYRVDQVWQRAVRAAAPRRRDDATCPRRCATDSPPSCRSALHAGHSSRSATTGDTVKFLWALARRRRDRDRADALPRPGHGVRRRARPGARWPAGSAPPARPGSTAT